MLACIPCSKQQLEDDGEDNARAATRPGGSREGVKSLTSQEDDGVVCATQGRNKAQQQMLEEYDGHLLQCMPKLASKIKDMVLKFSGSYRQCKGSSSSSLRSKSFHQQHRQGSSYTYEDAAEYGRMREASSTTPTWDLSNVNELESRLKAKWVPSVSSTAAEDVVLEDNEPKEWTAQVEPGVHITFVSLPGGAGNELKRIRFSREMFNKWQAQRWWGENYDRIMELYNVQRYNRQALQTPARSDDGERESMWSRVGSTRESPVTPPAISKERLAAARDVHHKPPPPSTSAGGKGHYYSPSQYVLPHRPNPASASSAAACGGIKGELSAAPPVDASRTTTSSRDEASVSISNVSDLELTEWVEQDEPGVYITIRELADGTRELRRVRFSRDKFGEVHAKLWWEANRERIQSHYL